jgi:hypothetical protein
MDEDEDEDPAGAGIDDEEQESVPAIYTTARDPKKLYLNKVHEQLLKVAHKWNVSLNIRGCDIPSFGFHSGICWNATPKSWNLIPTVWNVIPTIRNVVWIRP